MRKTASQTIAQTFEDFINDKTYPCVAARAAMNRKQVPCMVAGHMACPNDDGPMLDFLYQFVDDFRKAGTSFHSAAVIFAEPAIHREEDFDDLMWQRLQALALLDAEHFHYDKRVNPDPSSPDFSFSLGGEAFFVIGLHPGSSRQSRKFQYPALVFNPHAQFEELRKTDSYENLKKIIRSRDVKYSGSINPMLADFGQRSEVYQYSGRHYNAEWQCPFKMTHAETKHHPTEK